MQQICATLDKFTQKMKILSSITHSHLIPMSVFHLRKTTKEIFNEICSSIESTTKTLVFAKHSYRDCKRNP